MHALEELPPAVDEDGRVDVADGDLFAGRNLAQRARSQFAALVEDEGVRVARVVDGGRQQIERVSNRRRLGCRA